MKKIHFQHPHRQAHFEFFNNMNHPYFNICANVELTEFIPFLKDKKIPFTPSIVYLISKTANSIKEFRWRIQEKKVVEHAVVHPSFSVYTEVADVFSFCEVEHQDAFPAFVNDAQKRMEEMRQNPSFSDKNGRDNCLFLSSIPWVSFTGFQHAMQAHPTDSVPRIVWGKYFEENGKIKMPLSVQVHHAVVDGQHVGQFFQEFERLAQELTQVSDTR
ncbi:MAG: chloramphenicol O-acetyltransferase type A [Paraglaciecola sp.]|jgi:chloramphenicol O-acetyltransferase type A